MTDTKSSPEKDSNNEMPKNNSYFHFKDMRKYFGAFEQFIKLVEPCHIIVPSSADDILRRNVLLALNSTIYNVKRVRDLLLTLPPRSNSVKRTLPEAIKNGLTGKANFPISVPNTRSKRKANSSATKDVVGLKKEANLSVSNKSIAIKKPIANILRSRGRNKVNIITNPPEIIDINDDDFEATEAAITLLQMKSSPGIDLITLENKKSNNNANDNSLVVQVNEPTSSNPSLGGSKVVVETVKSVQQFNTTQVSKCKQAPESITRWTRTTQVFECKKTLGSVGERLKITQSINLAKPPQLIANDITQSMQLNKIPQLIGSASEASTSQVLRPPEPDPREAFKPILPIAKTYTVPKSKFMEVAERAFPRQQFNPPISWTEFLALPNPTVKIKNVLYTIREVNSEVLTFEPTLKLN